MYSSSKNIRNGRLGPRSNCDFVYMVYMSFSAFWLHLLLQLCTFSQFSKCARDRLSSGYFLVIFLVNSFVFLSHELVQV